MKRREAVAAPEAEKWRTEQRRRMTQKRSEGSGRKRREAESYCSFRLPERSRSVERQRKVDSSGEKEKEKKEKDEKKEKKEKKHQKTPSISSTEDLSGNNKRKSNA